MPDWQRLVEAELVRLKLPREVKQEVIAELASHLEDCESAWPQGFCDRLELKSRKLARAIQRAKGEHSMNRTKAFWIPMFVNLLFTSLIINICNWLGWIDGRITEPGAHPAQGWNLFSHALQPWLLVLPICGATAAFLARRSHGSPAIRALAALFPSFVWLASVPVVKLIFFCFPGVFAAMPLSAFASAAVGWFVFPALALFVGAVPFLLSERRQVTAE